MDYKQVKNHWDAWAKQFGTALRATTKSMTIKQLEIFALMRHMTTGARILDVGCGNGYNSISFVTNKKDVRVIGVDYSKDMIDNAKRNASSLSPQQRRRLEFVVGDALNLSFREEFDIVTTNRCIINFTNLKMQKLAIKKIVEAICPKGLFLMLENSQQNYGRQNDAREAVGLPRRTPPVFNLFLDETIILPFCKKQKLELLSIDDFSALHDLMLYVILTANEPGKEHYDEPLIAKAAELTMNLAERGYGYPFGAFGQNRLYVFRKTKKIGGVRYEKAELGKPNDFK